MRKARALGLLATIWLASCNSPVPDSAGVPPNIVLILVDDLGWSDLPPYGNSFHETPHIDRMAANGLRFTNAYAAAPVCSPTRASIQSGQYPARIGITDFIRGHWRPYEQLTVPINRTQYLPLDVVTVGEALQQQGYVTGYFGKWHLGNPEIMPGDQGYDQWFVVRGGRHFDVAKRIIPPAVAEPEEYLSDVITERGLKFLQDHRNAPFFLTLAHYAVHIPLQAEKLLIEKYQAKEKPDVGVNNPIYAAMIEHIDQGVGQVLDELQELGLSENTLVLLSSDNGGLFERFDKADGVIVTSNSPLRDEKGSLYEGGIRVPFIAYWPGVVPPGSATDVPVVSVDLYPTLVELAHGVMPQNDSLDGISLVPLLSGDSHLPSRSLYFHYPHYHHSAPASAIRVGNFKLIEFLDGDRVELYNLSSDISENRNLAPDFPDKAASMQVQLQKWRNEVNAPMPMPNPDFDESRRGEWGRHPSWQ